MLKSTYRTFERKRMTKPKRKRVSKKQKLNADAAYVVFNMLVPDDGPLASANAAYEMLNGKLSTPDGDGHDASRGEEASLAGMIGYVVLPSEQFAIRRLFPCPLPADEVYARCGAAIRELPSGTLEEEGGGHGAIGFPTTVGAMALWQTPDGAFWTVFYHHPNVSARLAAAILKEVVDDFEKDDTAEASGSDGNNN